jgi:hypothetical protein
LAGWTINLTGTNDTGQPVNVSTTTDASGNYSFNVAPGTYTASETLQTGWFQSAPAGGQHNVTLAVGDEQTGNLFGNYQNATASGTKFHDLNEDGVRDAAEPVLSDWMINLTGTNGAGQPVNLSTTTDASGNFSFDVSPGTYAISEVLQTGWTRSSPASGVHNIMLSSGQILGGFEFGNFQQVSLLGDYNGDSVVDDRDYEVWRRTFGLTEQLAADGNGNGVIDAADYVVWRDNRGTSLGAGLSSATVPEPTTVAVAVQLFGLCIMLAGRCQRPPLIGSLPGTSLVR